MAKLHELKTWPEAFRGIARGLKTHEVRQWDRNYEVGDVLRLKEWNPATERYTGEELDVEVTWLTDPGEYGMDVRSTCVMSIRPVIRNTAIA